MTTQQTKNELNKEFKNMKCILTSSMRTKLLLSTYEGPQNLEDLRKKLKKPSATILHGLKELENINLIRKIQKNYELTSNGYLLTTNMIKLIENWYSINKCEEFWNNHDLNDIPERILKEIYLLKNSKYIHSTTSNLSNAFNTYINYISNSTNLKIILPIYSENHFKHIIQILDNNNLSHLELVVNEEIINSIDKNEIFKEKILNNNKVEIICIKKKLKIFLTYSEEFMSLTLFFKDGHYDDSQILIAEDANAIKWSSNLYKHILEENND